MTQRNASTIESSLHELLARVLADAQLELVDVVCTGLGTATAAVQLFRGDFPLRFVWFLLDDGDPRT